MNVRRRLLMKELAAAAIVLSSLLIGFYLAGAGTLGILSIALLMTLSAIGFLKLYRDVDLALLFALVVIITPVGAGIKAFVDIVSRLR